MSAIEILVERNRGNARPMGQRSWPKLCVITCDDASLTGQLEPGLGLQPGDAVIVRLPAGGGSLSQEIVQRAVAKACFVDNCDEVLLLTHSACTLYQLSANTIIDALNRAKVPRSAVPYDLRELVGAGRDPREAVRECADLLRRCAFLPPSLLVHVGHLDESTGELVIVENGEEKRIERPEDSARHVSGYQPGPAAPVEAQLPVVAVPESKPLEYTPISVTLPEVTVIPGEQALVLATPVPKPTPPPPSPRPAPPKKRATARPAPQVPRAAQPLQPNLPANVLSAIEKVRLFLEREVRGEEIRKADAELFEAARKGKSADELVKVALRPILKTGEKRYQVIDDMITIKDGLTGLPPSRAEEVLHDLLG